MVDSKENYKFDLGVKGLKPSTPSATLIFLSVSHACKFVLHEDFDSYLLNQSINVITPHQSEVPLVGKQIFQELGFAY